MDTPLLLIIWRRPHTLRQVIDAIRPVAPSNLFVACDGPNPDRPEEAEKVAATRRVIDEEIDWPCKIDRLYSDLNQGCSLGPINAITWFFEQVEEGIILEDDCVPHPDFFFFCTSLLERYRYDTRVWCISGNNFQDGQWRGDGSYFFSHYSFIWGWASWRRCWQAYDPFISKLPELLETGYLHGIMPDQVERNYWTEIWLRTYKRAVPVSWWDYQWFFICIVNRGLTIQPNLNLVSNIGFGEGASHFGVSPTNVIPSQPLGALSHPAFILPDPIADGYSFAHHFGGAQIRRRSTFLFRISSRLLLLALRLSRLAFKNQ